MNTIDIRGFKVIYDGRVYNGIEANVWFAEFGPDDYSDGYARGLVRAERYDVVAQNEDGNIVLICDSVDKIQFLKAI